MDNRRNKLAAWVGGILVLVTVALYFQVRTHDFVNWDDPDYVTENSMVRAGLTWNGVVWAFSQPHAANWHPFTWISHMADVQLWGMNPAGHHLTNVALHAACSLILFLWLFRATGSVWRSGMVAALFAWHPLHVESVAWVAERKDVLSAAFGLLCLWAYSRCCGGAVAGGQWSVIGSRVERGEGRGARGRKAEGVQDKAVISDQFSVFSRTRRTWYFIALAIFALGLMSKPMLVTWPFVLLLVDLWPLGRWQFEGRKTNWKRLGQLAMEKSPFFLLTAASCMVTVLAQRAGGAVVSVENLPFATRLANAVVSLAAYAGKLIWPTDLSVLYPHPDHLDEGAVLGAAIVILAATLAAGWWGRKRPFLPAGWLWYLGTLVPVLGLMQVGIQAYADRYTYIPSIGFFIAVVWGAASLAPTIAGRRLLAAIAALALAGCLWLTFGQIGYWRDTETLFTQARRATGENALASAVLAQVSVDQKKFEQALGYAEEACRIRPQFVTGHIARGRALLYLGRTADAEAAYGQALELRPDNLEARVGYAMTLAHRGNLEGAIENLKRVATEQPNSIPARSALGMALAAAGRGEEALPHLVFVLEQQPGAAANFNVAAVLVQAGKTAEAKDYYARAQALDPGFSGRLKGEAKDLAAAGQTGPALARYQALAALEPGNADVESELGLLLAGAGKLAEATQHFEAALKLRPDAQACYNLGLACKLQHQPVQALEHFRKAVELRPDWPVALNDLAWLLATAEEPGIRNGTEARRLAEQAADLTGRQQPMLLGTLAAAYAETGDFPKAIQTAEQARDLAMKTGLKQVADRNTELIELYKAGKPVREN